MLRQKLSGYCLDGISGKDLREATVLDSSDPSSLCLPPFAHTITHYSTGYSCQFTRKTPNLFPNFFCNRWECLILKPMEPQVLKGIMCIFMVWLDPKNWKKIKLMQRSHLIHNVNLGFLFLHKLQGLTGLLSLAHQPLSPLISVIPNYPSRDFGILDIFTRKNAITFSRNACW